MPRDSSSKRMTVDREEYAALVALRDGAHEALKVKLQHAEDRYRDVLAINAEIRGRLVRQDLELTTARGDLAEAVKRLGVLAERVKMLEPVRCETEQPLFAHAASVPRRFG